MKKVGVQQYINANTGETINVQVFEIEKRDFNIEKILGGHIVEVLKLLGGKKIQVVMYILENRNSDNLILGTQRKIAKKIGASLETVNETFRILQESGFLTQEGQGIYKISSNIMFKNSKDNGINVLYKYKNF